MAYEYSQRNYIILRCMSNHTMHMNSKSEKCENLKKNRNFKNIDLSVDATVPDMKAL